ncbi:hypothetical protein H8356DRAFT_1362602 [Neocallimastix lanati (nom. inval.)]|nr:hypothetical protein H8356DRAFT_1362602 [Neocallimastix sp. JGI-2020a]
MASTSSRSSTIIPWNNNYHPNLNKNFFFALSSPIVNIGYLIFILGNIFSTALDMPFSKSQ